LRWQLQDSRSLLERSLLLPDDESSNLFAITDTNKDGKMTFTEWRDSTVRSTFKDENNAMLLDHWAKYDTANVGYLSEDKAVYTRA